MMFRPLSFRPWLQTSERLDIQMPLQTTLQKHGAVRLGRSRRSLAIATILMSSLVSSSLVGGCATERVLESGIDRSQASMPEGSTETALDAPTAAPTERAQGLAGADAGAEVGTATTFVADASQAAPQLVKRAEMSVEVDTIDEAVEQAMAIARSTGGDVLNLQNQTPGSETATHTAYVEMRVPQNQLDEVLNRLTDLGTVKRQSLSAEDVSAQLVDFEARLRNLRKAEEMTLGIMERSGEIGEVLQVAQELRNIRGSIEQIDGQLSALQTQVRFSTVALNLISPGASTPSQQGVLSQIQTTWDGATRSMATFTVDLLQVGIWLMVYSPYVVVVGGLVWWGWQRRQRDRSPWGTRTLEPESKSVGSPLPESTAPESPESEV